MVGEELKKQSIWAHIEALRGLLLRSAMVLGVFTVATFTIMPWLFDNVIMAPTRGDFFLYRWVSTISTNTSMMPRIAADANFQVHIININLASQFFTHMSASFWVALVLAFPIILYLMWKFVEPALYSGERKNVGVAFIVSNLMFYLGVAVGYCLVFPITLRFLAEYQLSSQILNQINLDSYMDNFFMLILLMGILFELPLLAWFLGRAGILKRSFFNKYRRHAIVALLVVAAVITPTGDPFTLMIVFLPTYLLWESGTLLTPSSTGRQYTLNNIEACEGD